jgi:hypothetical protein
MATTPNFNWSTPDNTGLVKNGALDIRTLGNSIDASMADLKGGTTGQVLAKATNTDMDFTWVASTAGDITAVTAGTGISGGGTSGDVTITNSMATAITTNGDLIYGTGSGTFTRRGIGTTGQVLTVSGGVPTWATPSAGGGGKVLQVVSTTKTDTFTSTSTSFTDITGLSVSITPSATTSKIMVFYNVTGSGDVGVNTSSVRLVRGATAINIGDAAGSRTPATNGIFEGETTAIGNASTNFLDSPSTTSATTYKIQVRCNNGGNSFINRSESDSDQGQNNRTTSTITVMEIGA